LQNKNEREIRLRLTIPARKDAASEMKTIKNQFIKEFVE
jgi:hypothetical protein